MENAQHDIREEMTMRIPWQQGDGYINESALWNLIRWARAKYDDFRCVLCQGYIEARNELPWVSEPSAPQLTKWQTHHETYERYGNEDIEDVRTLCKKHHDAISNEKTAKGKGGVTIGEYMYRQAIRGGRVKERSTRAWPFLERIEKKARDYIEIARTMKGDESGKSDFINRWRGIQKKAKKIKEAYYKTQKEKKEWLNSWNSALEKEPWTNPVQYKGSPPRFHPIWPK